MATSDITGIVESEDKVNFSRQPGSIKDPYSDPEHPRIITFQEVSAASYRIKGAILRTPCTLSHLSETMGMELYFKKEFLQYTGSFKERGARCALVNLSEDQKKKGVVSASNGNHGLALSYHGKLLGIQVTLVVPHTTPLLKIYKCRTYGAIVLVHGNNVAESREYALKLMVEKDLTYINGYDHPHVIAGHGTIGLEVIEQMDNLDAMIIPIGGGGSLAGVAVAIKTLRPNVCIVGVEPERCASFSASLKAGKPVYISCTSSLADGLLNPTIGPNALATALPLVDKVVSVNEELISIAILRLMQQEKCIIEGAAAVTLAALLSGQLAEFKGKRVVSLLGGGNIDTTLLIRCLERGLTIDGRLVKFTITIPDRPNGLADLTRTIADAGVTIRDIIHERAWLRSDVFTVRIKVVAETRDREHAKELESILKARYQDVYFNAGGSADKVGKTRSRSKGSVKQLNPSPTAPPDGQAPS